MNYALLNSLVAQLEAFEKEHQAGAQTDIADFAAWLGNRVLRERKGVKQADNTELDVSIETEIGRKVIKLNRYVRLYSRNALQHTQIQSSEEFSYLATLLKHGQLKKTELITKNIHEKPTGMEIIRRLLNAELIDQQDDPADQRSKILKLTPKGRGVLFQVFKKMEKVSTLASGNLSREEKHDLLYLLSKLDDFHDHLFTTDRKNIYADLRGEGPGSPDV
ncbi:MarR family winged helix-turn-helix transcriptional regulator [uncultured Chitinophaga sp.]|uniref:MarR family winged helix-turn-helix transcriptional regulator n=1 Tax=uncultured Chitinophaga sp. TaxID=339340 RepID=UPI0025F7F8B1|nr:MarR family winged helix-turn-helix transcriptional regulator [uncultured Chitinophaga sp.]